MPDAALFDTLFQSVDPATIVQQVAQDPSAILNAVQNPGSLAAISVTVETSLSGPATIFPYPPDATVSDGSPTGGVSAGGFGGLALRILRPKLTATVAGVTIPIAPYGDPGNMRVLVYGGMILTSVVLVGVILRAIFGGK